MPVETVVDEICVTAYLSGDIDHHNAKALRDSIDSVVETTYPEVLVLDFGGVAFMDSSGIGLVMGRWKLMQDLGGTVVIENASASIRKVMRMAGIEKLLKSTERRKNSHETDQ